MTARASVFSLLYIGIITDNFMFDGENNMTENDWLYIILNADYEFAVKNLRNMMYNKI